MSAVVSNANAANLGNSRMPGLSTSGFAPYRRYRPIILASIVGLHFGMLIYATLLKPATVKPPEIAPVAMMQLFPERPATASMQTSMPAPEALPVATPQPMQPQTEPPAIPVQKPRAAKSSPKKPAAKLVVKKAPALPHPIPTPVKISSPSIVETASATTPSARSSPAAERDADVPVAQIATATATVAEPKSVPVAAVATPAEAPSPPSFSAAYLNNPPPVYPAMARRMGEEGRVLLRVYVTPQGTAGEVNVFTSSGSTMFDDAAQAAVKAWRFVPARQGESAVAAWVKVPIVFKLS